MAGLGRNVIVRPGQAVPDGWDDVARWPVGPNQTLHPSQLLAELRQLADDRIPRIAD